jgi:hypothetical protein
MQRGMVLAGLLIAVVAALVSAAGVGAHGALPQPTHRVS